jgi:hypothetical protein
MRYRPVQILRSFRGNRRETVTWKSNHTAEWSPLSRAADPDAAAGVLGQVLAVQSAQEMKTAPAESETILCFPVSEWMKSGRMIAVGRVPAPWQTECLRTGQSRELLLLWTRNRPESRRSASLGEARSGRSCNSGNKSARMAVPLRNDRRRRAFRQTDRS